MVDKMSGRSRGFGFVWFRDRYGLDGAIERLHNSDLDGRRIDFRLLTDGDGLLPRLSKDRDLGSDGADRKDKS